jgi:DNA-binding transcriptional LysR family regulator
LEKKHPHLTLQELEALPIICLEKNTSTRTYINQFLIEQGITLRPEFELATSDMIVQFALRSLGIGLVVKPFAQTYIDSGELFELQLKCKIPTRHFCLIEEERYPKSAAAMKLLAMLKLS